MTTLPTLGRGSWTKAGKDNGTTSYSYFEGTPKDGSTPDVDDAHRAVHLGVLAIQNRIIRMGWPGLVDGPLTPAGTFGPRTQTAVFWAQAQLAIGYSTGGVGQITAKALWHKLIADAAGRHQVPAGHLFGLMMRESGADPGAVGYETPSDHGLFQINIVAHAADVSYEQAHDPVFASEYTAARMASARTRFAGSNHTLQTACSIAQHNSPLWAQQWFAAGKPPNAQIADYVNIVLSFAAEWTP